ncbi:MAG: peptidylprolyl isomerase [Gammaproteobacteria bacterium]|nr:peptidylprolyl isomerase [Gammaproteobacteria bacterium]MBT8445245.1 peptidylprolyl isomerase [Gammaproteobacteria bacterium]NND36773.1 molecular chaperone SurA [Gammaproteobacteria bacterium]
MNRLRLFFIGLCLGAATQATAQTLELSSTGQRLDGIVAIVNDGVVLASELDAEVANIVERLQQQGTPIPDMNALVPQVLERLVVQRIQLQRAERLGVQIPDEMLNVALSNIAERNGVALSDMPQLLEAQGVDYNTYREDMRNQLAVDQLRQRDVIGRINVTPRELDEYLERQQGRGSASEEFKLSHILISISASASSADIDAAEARTNELYEKAAAGAPFAELAVAFSDGQNALEGGSIGWRKGTELPTLFAEVVPGLQVGQIAEPIRSASGFHIVRLDDLRGAEPIMENQTRARHILITTNEVLDDYSAEQKLIEIREQVLAGDDFAAVAKAVSEDPGSAVEGGDLGWQGPGTFVPEFQAVCDTLEIDEISQPFKSPFGWHIVQLLERRVYDKTDEVERQQAIMAIRNSKLEEETELWARRMRDQAYVEYRL